MGEAGRGGARHYCCLPKAQRPFVAAKALLRWFRARTLLPFAIYSLAFGLLCVVHFA